MPFFIPAVAAAVGAVATGFIRENAAKKRVVKATEEYESILRLLEPAKLQFDKTVQQIGETSFRGMDSLSKAQKMLNPLLRARRGSFPQRDLRTGAIQRSVKQADELSLAFVTATGIGTGAVLAAGAWTVLATFGTASTGTAIATLHGAALTHATLAALGGGALAAGGGGMAAGTAMLFHLAIIPVTALMAWKTHSDANELNSHAEEMEAANEANRKTLMAISKDAPNLTRLNAVLSNETDVFADIVSSTYRKIYPLGYISIFWRRLRVRFWGTYYKSKDMPYIEHLSDAVDRFVSLFAPEELKKYHP